MVKFTEIESQKILSLYRSYLQTNHIELTEEDKEFMLKGIELKNFDCNQANNGIMLYRNWYLPLLLIPGSPDLREAGLNHNNRVIADRINYKILVECLFEIWNGKVTDEMLLYASLIEAGHSLDVLPIMQVNITRIGAEVSALFEAQKQKDEKHEDLQQ